MNQRMLIGRYIERDSWVHRLDPRAKTAAMPLFMIAVFMIDSYVEVLAVLVFSVAVMLATKIPLSFYVRAVKPLIFLLLFIALFHLFTETGGKRIVHIGGIALYSGGLAKGVIAASRMTLFLSFTALLTFTTQPDRLALGLGSLLAPLKRIGVPTDKLVLMLRIALRFIPTIFDEAERLYKAQQSRGLNLSEKSLAGKAKLMIALLVPVTAGVFRRSVGLADSMEARGYRIGAPRTSFRTFAWSGWDTLFLLLFALPIAAAAFL